jgi:hypothetical protein
MSTLLADAVQGTRLRWSRMMREKSGFFVGFSAYGNPHKTARSNVTSLNMAG